MSGWVAAISVGRQRFSFFCSVLLFLFFLPVPSFLSLVFFFLSFVLCTHAYFVRPFPHFTLCGTDFAWEGLFFLPFSYFYFYFYFYVSDGYMDMALMTSSRVRLLFFTCFFFFPFFSLSFL